MYPCSLSCKNDLCQVLPCTACKEVAQMLSSVAHRIIISNFHLSGVCSEVQRAPSADCVEWALYPIHNQDHHHHNSLIIQESAKPLQTPEDCINSLFNPLPKKGDMKQCTAYRTLGSQTNKSSSRWYLEGCWQRQSLCRQLNNVDSAKAEVRKIKIKILQSSCRQLYVLCRSKAFDCVSHEILRIAMKDMSYHVRIVNLLAGLHC